MATFIVLLIGCIACQTESTHSVHTIPQAELLVIERVVPEEERILNNKIRSRDALRHTVEDSEAVEKEIIRFACSRNTGGILTKIKDDRELIGIRFGQRLEEQIIATLLYFDKEMLKMIVYEEDSWENEYHKTKQTIFYLENEHVFHCLHRIIPSTDRLGSRIEQVAYSIVDADKKQLDNLLTQAKIWQSNIDEKNIAAYYCQ